MFCEGISHPSFKMIIFLNKELSTFPVPIGECIYWVHGKEEIKTYALQCPKCHHAFCLADHKVENGVVSPSVVCPFNCGFHEMVTIQ